MKNLKILVIFLTLAIFCFGCGTKKNSSTDTPADQDTAAQNGEASKDSDNTNEDESLNEIKSKGKFVLGLDDSFPPMGFRDEEQNIVGFDIDAATEVCKRMGVELLLQPISWDAKEQELLTKNIDCIWNGFTYSEEREQAMTLSGSYLRNTQVIVIPAASGIAGKADLAGKTVVLQNGSTAEHAVDSDPDFKNSLKNVVAVKDNVKALMELEIGGADAAVMDEVVARYYITKEPDKFKVLDEKLADEEYVIGFRKGDEALCSEIEKQLKAMYEEGVMKELSEKWMGEDLTIAWQ